MLKCSMGEQNQNHILEPSIDDKAINHSHIECIFHFKTDKSSSQQQEIEEEKHKNAIKHPEEELVYVLPLTYKEFDAPIKEPSPCTACKKFPQHEK